MTLEGGLASHAGSMARFGSNESVTWVPSDRLGPLFFTVSVYVKGVLSGGTSVLAVLVIWSSSRINSPKL